MLLAAARCFPSVARPLGWLFLDERVTGLALVRPLAVFGGFVPIENRELAAELARHRGAAR